MQQPMFNRQIFPLISTLFVIWAGLKPAPTHAAGDPSSCLATIRSVQLKNTAGEWITVVEPDSRVELVSAEDPGISFVNNGRVPPGEYSGFRLVLEPVFTVTGADGENKTAEGGNVELALGGGGDGGFEVISLDESFESLGRGVAGKMTVRLKREKTEPGEAIYLSGEGFETPVLVRKASFIGVWFKYDLRGSLHFAPLGSLPDGTTSSQAMYFQPPSRLSGVMLTVDTASLEIPGEGITVEIR